MNNSKPLDGFKDGEFLVNLDNCAREPIHIPSAIQPFGALLAFDPVSGVISHSSSNLSQLIPSGGVFDNGRSLAAVLGEAQSSQVLAALANKGSARVRHSPVALTTSASGEPLPGRVNAQVHVYRGVGILEIEPSFLEEEADDWSLEFEDAIDLLRDATDVENFARMVAVRFRKMTGFDRVMVYKFSEDWTGRVIGDAHEAGMESFYDLHYPASDIPAQARELYRQNLVRYIADVSYQPVPVMPRPTAPNQVLDMSHCALRSVSPIHLQYLKNMGVGSTLVLSIMQDNKLWGLISCQHRNPTRIPFRLRRACHAFSVSASYILKGILLEQHSAERQSVLEASQQIERRFSQSQVALDELVEQSAAQLLRLGKACAGAFWHNGRVFGFGLWPDGQQADAILGYVQQQLQITQKPCIFEDNASFNSPIGLVNKQRYCGYAAVNFDPFATSGVLLLRPEHKAEVLWGGDPNKPVSAELDEHGRPLLSPRTSFAAWREEVSGRCQLWSELDRHAIANLIGLQQVLTVRESLIQVRLSNNQFRSLVALQSEVYWQADIRGELLVFSRDLFFQSSEILGSSLTNLFTPYCDSKKLRDLDQLFLSVKAFRGFEISGTNPKTGEVFYFAINGEPMRDGDGKVTGMHGTISDVTVHRERETSLAAAKELADMANRAKTTFLATMSHEIRTPLNALIGLGYLLEQSIKDEANQLILKRMKTAGQSLLALINDVLDLAKIEAQELVIAKEPLTLQRVIADAVLVMEIQALSKGLSLNIGPLPKGFPEVVIGDAQRIRQVLINLVGNAIKFTEVGSVSLAFKALPTRSRQSKGLSISVVDTGIGIPPQDIIRLFEPFVQLDSGNRRGQGGTGLGLTIVRQLVNMMGGSIKLLSEVDKGTTAQVDLYFDLPKKRNEKATKTTGNFHSKPGSVGELEPMDSSKASGNKPLEGMSILLVDDNELNQLVAENILSLSGATVTTCDNGQQAIDWLQEPNNCVDVVLMDVQMPVLDGIEATRRLRTDQRFLNLPIVGLTAASTLTDREESIAAGMSCHLSKPIEPETIISTLLSFRSGVVNASALCS